MNPRYAAYAAAHGLSPEAMLERAREEYPGGRMAGFMVWIGQQWQAWFAEKTGTSRAHTSAFKSLDDHADFDRWLGARQVAS